MNAYHMQFPLIVLTTLFYGMNGMENKPQLSMIERKVTIYALSKLLCVDNEKILHVGFSCEDMIQQKAHGLQAYCIDTQTLNMLEKPEVGYDKILSFMCWDVIKNSRQVLLDSARLLKSHGQFCAVIPYYKSDYLKVYGETLMSDKWKDRYNKDGMIKLYGSTMIKKELERTGLGSNAHCEIVKKPFTFKTREKLVAWVASCSENSHVLSPEYHAEFINDLVNNYLEVHPLKDDHSVRLYFPYIIIRGYKS